MDGNQLIEGRVHSKHRRMPHLVISSNFMGLHKHT